MVELYGALAEAGSASEVGSDVSISTGGEGTSAEHGSGQHSWPGFHLCHSCGQLFGGREALAEHVCWCTSRPASALITVSSDDGCDVISPSAVPAEPFFICRFPGCGNMYQSTEHALKHARKHHPEWLKLLREWGANGYCERVEPTSGPGLTHLSESSAAQPPAQPLASKVTLEGVAPTSALSIISSGSPSSAAPNHSKLVHRLEQYMSVHAVSQATISSRLGLSSAGKLSLWRGHSQARLLLTASDCFRWLLIARLASSRCGGGTCWPRRVRPCGEA